MAGPMWCSRFPMAISRCCGTRFCLARGSPMIGAVKSCSIVPEDERARRHAPATARNREPIFSVLQRVLPSHGLVLEVASGTGEHAVFLAPRLPHLLWQPTDVDAENCRSIAAWQAVSPAENLLPPLILDAE